MTSIFVLTACDDKTSQQSLESDKRVAQLNSELTELKTRVEKCTSQSFPALQVEKVSIFDKKEAVKFTPDVKDEITRDQSEIKFSVSGVKTGIEWLDALLYQHLLLNYGKESKQEAMANKEISSNDIKTFVEKRYQESIQKLKEDKLIGYENIVDSYYIGQRHNIAMFSQSFYYYEGGAHGMDYTNYLNIDVNKKKVIQLDDLVSPQNQVKLQDILSENYLVNHPDEREHFSGSDVEKALFKIPNNFYFTPSGINFVYPVYALGAYSDGQVEVSVNFYDLKGLINKDYLLKDE